MQKIGDLLNQSESQSLTVQRSTPGNSQISELLQEGDWESLCEQLRQAGTPEWEILVIQMAQDMRHDISPAVMPLWREKLKRFSDVTVCRALKSFSGRFFPSLPDVLEAITRDAEDAQLAKSNREWVERKEAEKKPGVLATEDQYEDLRRECREILAKAPVITAKPQAKVKSESIVSEVPSPAD